MDGLGLDARQQHAEETGLVSGVIPGQVQREILLTEAASRPRPADAATDRQNGTCGELGSD